MNKKDDSMTNVHFSKKGVYKYVSGNRKPIAIRIDEGLYNRFKPLSKQVYGSVCRAIETYIISFISAVENGVHFSNTETPINIERIVIERNLRPRRKLEVDEVNFYHDGLWTYVADAVLNSMGHAVGCGCKVCDDLEAERVRQLREMMKQEPPT